MDTRPLYHWTAWMWGRVSISPCCSRLPPTTTITMGDIENPLGFLIRELSDQNYEQSFACYRFWFDVGKTYHQLPPDQLFDAIWKNRGGKFLNPVYGSLIHSTAHSILRFASDVESDPAFAPYNSGLQDRLRSRSLREFFSNNLIAVADNANRYKNSYSREFCIDANLIAHWANLGCVEEAVIRNLILQSLISHPKLYNHQADALIVLFKLAGATFGAYADPSVVNRCFELLKNHYDYCAEKTRLVKVRAPHSKRRPPS